MLQTYISFVSSQNKDRHADEPFFKMEPGRGGDRGVSCLRGALRVAALADHGYAVAGTRGAGERPPGTSAARDIVCCRLCGVVQGLPALSPALLATGVVYAGIRGIAGGTFPAG